MVSGFALGGFGTAFQKGMEQNDLAQYRQKELQLQQQGQQNAQQRFETQRIDGIINDSMKSIADQVAQFKTVDIPNDKIASQLMPWVEHAADVAEKSGRPGGRAAILAQFSASLAVPSPTKTMAAEAAAKEPPGSFQERAARAQYYRSQAQLFSPEPEGPAAAPAAAAAPATAATPGAPGAAAPAPGTVVPTSREGTEYINAPYTPRQKAIIGTVGATPQQFDFDAVMYAYGNQNVATGYRSYHGINPVTVLRSRAAQYWMDKYPGQLGPQEANAVMTEFKAMQHGANTAANQEARMTTALSKAQNTAQILPPLIAKVDRTKFKDWNDFMVNVDKRTGGENEIRLGIGLETLASNFGSTLGMGNSVLTDFQTKRAEAMIQQGWNSGQLGAAVNQIMQEMTREEVGTRQGLRKFIGSMQDTMRAGSAPPPDTSTTTTTGGGKPAPSGTTVHGFTFTPSGTP